MSNEWVVNSYTMRPKALSARAQLPGLPHRLNPSPVPYPRTRNFFFRISFTFSRSLFSLGASTIPKATASNLLSAKGFELHLPLTSLTLIT